MDNNKKEESFFSKRSVIVIILIVAVIIAWFIIVNNSVSSKKSDDYKNNYESVSSYNCSYNTYNCDDFYSWREAQDVFKECGGSRNDVHRLDRDGDGIACETLR